MMQVILLEFVAYPQHLHALVPLEATTMPQQRHLTIPCPNCGHVGRHMLEPTEHAPLVTLVWCDAEFGGCDLPFAVEVRLRVEVEYSTCRLLLPSTTQSDCLAEAERLPDAFAPEEPPR
jgi:hypothetical protein